MSADAQQRPSGFSPRTKPNKSKPEAYNQTIETVKSWSQDQIDTIRANVRRHAPDDHHLMFQMLIDIDDE